MGPELQELYRIGACKEATDGADPDLLEGTPGDLDIDKFERDTSYRRRMGPELQELHRIGACKEATDGADPDLLEGTPDNLDRDKFERGKQFFKRNVVGCIRGMVWSLIVGISLDHLLEELVLTGETSKPADAFRRYYQTIKQVLKWHYGDIWDKNSSARKAVMFVRYRHFKARKNIVEKDKERMAKHDDVSETKRSKGTSCTSKSNDVDSRSSEQPPVRISQYDMSLVQSGFIGMVIMYPNRCGISCTESELDDFVYVWKWIGRLMGIDDSNNVCVGGFKRAYMICKDAELKLVFPALTNPPKQYEPMANAILDGIKEATRNIVSMKLQVLVALTFEGAGFKVPFEVSFGDRLRMLIDYGLTKAMMYIPGFTRLLNFVLEMAFGCSKMA